MAKKHLLKFFVIGGSIFLANCGNDPVSNVEENLIGGDPNIELSSSSITLDPITGLSSSAEIIPGISSSIEIIPRISSSSEITSGISSSSEIVPEVSSSSEVIPESSSSSVASFEVKVFLAGDNVNTNGPIEYVLEENIGFSGGGHILVRPKNFTNEANTKYPVAIWGPGGGTPPKDYLMLLNRMASQGFVVIGIRESSGDSQLMSAAIDWLEEQDKNPNSPMYNKLILNRVGVFGHSMGGLSSEQTALKDSRVATALLDNSGAFDHAQLVNMKVPTGIIYGEDGMERPNAEGDYNNLDNRGPLWLGMMAKGGHGSGPWDGAGANVAWMRWHIGGESFRKDAFLGQGGEYNNNGIWTTKFKNWENWKNWNE